MAGDVRDIRAAGSASLVAVAGEVVGDDLRGLDPEF